MVEFCTLKFNFTFLVVLKEHEVASKLLFRHFNMASCALSGACWNYQFGQPRASSWALPITRFFLHEDRLENDRVLHLTWVISRPVQTKNVPTARTNHLPVSTQSSADNYGALQK